MYKTNRQLGLLYVVSMIIAFTTRYGDVMLGYEHQIIIGALWVMSGIISVLYKNKRNIRVQNYRWGVKIFLIPHIIIHLYTIVLMMLGKVSFSYFTTNMTVYIPTMVAITSVYFFGKNAFKYNAMAVIGSWTLSIIVSLILKGPAIIPQAIIQAYIDPYSTYGGIQHNYFELHDLVLGIGYIFVFYLFTQQKVNKRNLLIGFATLLILTLGMKRITVIGIFLAFVFHFLIRRMKDKNQLKVCLLAGWAAFVVCYLFIFILSQGSLLFEILGKYDINFAGRNYYYQAIMKYSSFSPTYLGIGRNVVTQIFNSELSYMRVGGAHSDVIKMYVENGFILFGLWLWYYLINVTKQFRNHYGSKTAITYFGLTIYTFTLYLTDNIEIYFICQILSISISLCYAIDGEMTKETLAHSNNKNFGMYS